MKNTANKDLFGSFSSGIELKNRIVVAPMTRSRAIDNIPNELMALYYSQRASAGLIITEGTSPSPNGLGYARIPGIYNKEQIQGWKKVTNAVHKEGGKIFVQLMHVGRVANLVNMPGGAEIIAPSAINAKAKVWTDRYGMQIMGEPRAMGIKDINETLREFVRAAINAMKAGFDGVEIHAANGYLLEQFLNPNTNKREDLYGGDIENRSRFILAVTRSVINAIGKEKVGVRISPYGTFNDMQPYAEIPGTYTYLVRQLNKMDILYVHLIDSAARTIQEGQDLIHSIRKNFKNALIFNGGYDRQSAEHALKNEGADLISFGSKFIANPDLPFKLQYNIPLATPNSNAFYTADEIGYIDYSFTEINKAA